MSTVELVKPRILLVPEYSSTLGLEAIEVAALAGLVLDPWQEFVLHHALGEDADARWSATEVALVTPRQNGKDAVLEARELAALFWFDEKLVIHSAHHFKTAEEHCLRLSNLMEGVPEFDSRIRRVYRSNGRVAIHLSRGQRIEFFTRTKSGGRGFSAPLVIFNEAMFLSESSLGALLPTQAAMANRQRWFAGSAVDQFVHEDGVVLARLRERALAGEDPRLAYFEWSVDAETPGMLEEHEFVDEDLWALSNPGLGLRIPVEAVEDELRSLDRRTFAVERLGVGDWPSTTTAADQVISPAAWNALSDESSVLADPVCLAFDVTPDRSFAAIAAAGQRDDGLAHVEIVEHRRGTGWVVKRLAELQEIHAPLAIMVDATGPAASLVHQLEELGVDVEMVSASEHAKACGLLVDMASQEQLRHLGDDGLASALKGATRRQLGDAWAWSRRNSAIDISPLVATTLALWGSATLGGGEGPQVW